MKKYNWPGNIRELKNIVESLIVMNSGDRITHKMVIKHLKLDNANQNNNLPISLEGDSDQLERELILKQLLYLRQDVNELKQILTSNSSNVEPSNPALFLPSPDVDQINGGHHGGRESIEDAGIYALNEDTIGEVSLDELEHEMIKRCLEKFNGNRRKTARALNISERTLYRKIKEYGI